MNIKRIIIALWCYVVGFLLLAFVITNIRFFNGLPVLGIIIFYAYKAFCNVIIIALMGNYIKQKFSNTYYELRNLTTSDIFSIRKAYFNPVNIDA